MTGPLRVVVDAFGVRAGSAAITLEHLLEGWTELGTGDRVTVLSAGEPEFAVPDGVEVERVAPPLPGMAGALWLRSFGVRAAAKRLGADGVVSGVTASAFAGTPCPRGAILYDLRHELRPHQFGRAKRLARRISYGWTFRTADALFCISHRTAGDLLRTRPWARDRTVVARYGSEHADAWKAPSRATGDGVEQRYVLAFGHFENKNVDAVLDAWALYCRTHPELTLRLVGMGKADRAAARERVAALGIADRVELMPWLDDAQFVECFAGASLILFPSDFEGFGLPAIEALRLRIPLVVSADPALAEVTGGHAPVAADVRPETIVAAVERALALTPEQLGAGRAHTEQFQWRFMAQAIRDALIRRSETAR